MNLFIVESPSKSKKIQSYLDELYGASSWKVMATVGHWRGLPDMSGQTVDTVFNTSTWDEQFVVHNNKVAGSIGSALKSADVVLLAADDDREGEAIAWHIAEEFNLRNVKRALYNEVTKEAIRNAVESPIDLKRDLVEAQRTRAALDYIIGMSCSRNLWRFGAKSAGRVQSAALRIVVDRENEIRNFKSEAFWTVHGLYKNGIKAAVATYEQPSDDDLDADPDLSAEPKLTATKFFNEADAKALIDAGQGVAHVVEKAETKPGQRKPRPPYMTTTMLADASTRFGWQPDKTSRAAQKLFEAGLVTYIRTDSVSLAPEAVEDIRSYLGAKHPELLPAEPIVYKDKKGAQGAHEAIRPTKMDNPDAAGLTGDEKTLYEAIHARTLACQAKPASTEKTTYVFAPGDLDWRLQVSGTVIVDPGFLALEGKGADAEPSLPSLAVGDVVDLDKMDITKGKTKPRPRFTVASLVAYLDRKGIGRPATTAAVFTTLTDRAYVKEAKKKLVPTEIGELADRLIRVAFDPLSQEGFTAATEKSLDKIAGGKLSRVDFLAQFFTQFTAMSEAAAKEYDDYAARHPELDRDRVEDHDKPCPKCDAKMVRRKGKFGAYAQCTSEDCGNRINLEPLKELKEPCPSCDGTLVEQPYKKDGKRRVFFRCTDCSWKNSSKPVVDKRKCPKCYSKVLRVEYKDKATKKKRWFWVCVDDQACLWKSPKSPPVISKYDCHNDPEHGPMQHFEGCSKDGKSFEFWFCLKCGSSDEKKGTFWCGPKPPDCPECGKKMRLLDGKKGKFWGCSAYKDGCKGIVQFKDKGDQ